MRSTASKKLVSTECNVIGGTSEKSEPSGNLIVAKEIRYKRTENNLSPLEYTTTIWLW